MGDVGAEESGRGGLVSRGRQAFKAERSGEIVRFGIEEGGPETEADRGAGMMVMDMAEMSAARRAMNGTVVLRIVEVDQADRENDGQTGDADALHELKIIPYKEEGVKPTFLHSGGPEKCIKVGLTPS